MILITLVPTPSKNTPVPKAKTCLGLHEKIELKPLNQDYTPIILTPEDADDFRVIGELVGVL